MPQIRQYDAPQNLGLQPTETGIEATVQSARRLGAFSNQVASATERVGDQAGRQIAGAVGTVGDVAVQQAEHSEISHGAAAFSQIFANAENKWNATVSGRGNPGDPDYVPPADPNDTSVKQRFLDTYLEPQLEKFRDAFDTEEGQRWAEQHIEQLRQHMFVKTAADMSSRAGQAAVVNARQMANSLSNAVHSDPSSMDAALKSLETSVDGIVGSAANLSPAEAGEVRSKILQNGKEEIVKSAALGAMARTGKLPPWISDPRYSPYLNGVEAKQLEQTANYYQRLIRNENNTARAQQDNDNKKDFNARLNQLEASTMPQRAGDPPQLPSDYWDKLRQLSIHPGAALEPGRLAAMVTKGEAVTARLGKPEPLAGVSHATTIDLLGQIRSVGADRMTTNDPIYKAYEAGKLNNGDFNFLTNEFNNSRTPEGQQLNAQKQRFLKGVEPSLDRSLMSLPDPEGRERFYEFSVELDRRMAEYRRLGKDPFDLLDPAKPDYMGKPETLRQFQGPLRQQILGAVSAAGGVGAQRSAPAVGFIKDGYRFNGGDPAKRESWVKVQ